MTHHLIALLRHFFHLYGYWTILVALLLENAGIPVPGETTLLLGSFLAFSEHTLRLPYIILVGVFAATLGDNLGYLIGRRGGRPLLERYQRFFHISAQRLAQGEQLFARHGSPAVFFARFIAGMRIFTGPLAGALRMEYKRFVLFNFFGAVVWVTTVALVGYFFGSQWRLVIHIFRRLDLVLLALLLIAVGWYWWRNKKRTAQEGQNS